MCGHPRSDHNEAGCCERWSSLRASLRDSDAVLCDCDHFIEPIRIDDETRARLVDILDLICRGAHRPYEHGDEVVRLEHIKASFALIGVQR